jgi:hypothetical protein
MAMHALGIVLIIIGLLFFVLLMLAYLAKAITIFQGEPIWGAFCILVTLFALGFGIWALSTGQNLTPPGPPPCVGAECNNPIPTSTLIPTGTVPSG